MRFFEKCAGRIYFNGDDNIWGRNDTAADFDNVIDLAKRLSVMIHPVLLTPLSTKRILIHLFEIPLSGFPMTHLLSLMKQIPMKRAMKKAYEKWKKERAWNKD